MSTSNHLQDGVYPEGRNANGFRKKINNLKRALKPEWDAMATGAPSVPATPKKTPATPHKRKTEANQEGSAKKPRARSNKKASTPSSGEDEEKMDLSVKEEPKEEEQFDNGDGELDATLEN